MSKRSFCTRDLPRILTLIVCGATQIVIARSSEHPATVLAAEVGRRDAVESSLRDPAGNRDVSKKMPPMDRPRPASSLPVLTARPGVMMADAQYVIITPLSLLEAFEPFAQYKRSQGTSTLVVAVEQIQALYADGTDVAESIRQFLQDADLWWHTRFVLLGGDVDLVPIRVVPNLSTVESLGPEISTDLYYAAIDGDWNADGDAIIGEIPGDGSTGDDVDVDPDLMVGRAPVEDATDVATFISKTIQYETSQGQAYRGRGLALAAEVWWLDPNTTLMISAAENTLAAGLGGLTSPPYVEHRYGLPRSWPGWEPMDEPTALARLGSGEFGWVFTALPGDSGRLLVTDVDLIGIPEFLALANAPHYFVMFVLGAMAADLQADSTLEILLRDPDGGCVAGISHTTVAYIGPDVSLLGTTMEMVLGTPGATLGESMNLARREWLQEASTTFGKLSSLSWILLGDPQLTMDSDPAVSSPTMAGGAALLGSRPNPLAADTEIRYRVPRSQQVDITVFDARGRRVVVLVQGVVEAGDHVVGWDGRDAAGQRVGSGVYFCRMRTDAFSKTRKLVVME